MFPTLMSEFKSKKIRGFTLIELLVVVAIISLLSSVVMTSLNSARAKGRDAQRTQSIHSVQLALELYFSDHSAYPSDGGAGPWSFSDLSSPLKTALVPKYISVLPLDPSGNVGTNGYQYYTNNSITFYAVKVNYEKTTPCYACANSVASDAYSCSNQPAYWGLQKCAGGVQ